MVRDDDGFTTVRRGGVDPHHAHKVLEFAKDMLATVRGARRGVCSVLNSSITSSVCTAWCARMQAQASRGATY